jgi:hypothetical protein
MKKSLIISSMAGLVALCTCLTAQAQGPMVVSDKDDYSPGETAMFSATGFQPNEFLDFSVAVSDDNGGWIADIAWADIPADASGGAEVDYVVPQTWADKTLQLSVMGLSSGLMAQTTFTDHAPAPTLSYSNWSVSASGNTVTVSVDIAFDTNGTNHSIKMVHAVLDNSLTVPLTGPSGNGEGTWSGSATGVCGTTYTLVKLNPVQIDSDPGFGGNHNDNNRTPPATFTATTDPCPTPTPSATASATPSATPCQNTPPVITCASPTPNADLGEVVGCLGTGTGFGQTFDVTYDNDGPGTTVTVTAHFTLPDSSIVDVDVATVTDPNGNTVTVTQSGPTSVTISGPGNGSAAFSVNIDANDGQDCNNTSSNMCDGTASADIVYHVHYLPPLYDMATTKVKQGSGVPVKMQLTDCSGIPITPTNIPGDTPTIDVTYLSGTVPSGPADVDDAGNSNGDTLYFRWSTDGPFWIFNLKTNSSYAVGATYEIQPSTVDNTAKISIK